MSIFNELYERTLARLLADHTAKGVPPDLDLWPAIQQRLIERDEAAERATEKEQAGLLVNATPLPIQSQRPAEGRGRRLLRSTGALAGMATFALLAVVTTLAISGLANRAERESQLALSKSGQGLVFSIPYGENSIQTSLTGFDIDENGSFWIADTSEQILRFTSAGAKMNPTSLSGPGSANQRVVINDLELSDGKVWVLHNSYGITAYTVLTNAISSTDYYPSVMLRRLGRVLISFHSSFVLRKGMDVPILLEQNGGPGYSDLVKADVLTNTDTVSLVGYPANGKIYTKGNDPNVIMTGDVPVTIGIDGSVTRWHILKVMPDNSFYVVVEAQLGPNGRDGVILENYVMRYGADGKLIDRARVPVLGQQDITRPPGLGRQDTLMKQLAIGPDNAVYAIVTRDTSEGDSSKRADVLRLHFYPASQPLPPAPPAPAAPTVPPTPVPPTPRPTPSLADDTTLVFSLPVGKGGVIPMKPSPEQTDYFPSFGFMAAAPDGSFWLADGADRLTHYGAEGKRLGDIPLPANGGFPFQMQVRDGDFWLYYRGQRIGGTLSNSSDPDIIYHLGPDGREIANYPVPDYIMGRTMGSFRAGFILGENGEVLLKGNFTNLMPGSPQFPSPVPTEQMPQTLDKPYWLLVDAQGNPAAEPLDGYTYGGRLYVVRQPYRHKYGEGDVSVGDVQINIPQTAGSFNAFDLLQVASDGSFYVQVSEEEDTGGPYITVYTTIYHYAIDGKLLERARVPMRSVRSLTGHPGNFYSILEQPDWEHREKKQSPDKIEIRRLTFYPADQPLPVMPTPEPPALPTPVLPIGNTVTPKVRLPIDFPLPTATNASLPPVSDPTTIAKATVFPATQITPTMLAGSNPVSFVRDGEGFRLDVHEGVASFGFGSSIRGSSPWLGPSRLAVRWDPILTQEESKSYMLNIENGKLEALPWSAREWSAVSRADGKRVVLVKPGDSTLTVNLFDMETGASETIYDFATTTKQWAGADTHIWDFGGVPLYGYAETTWIGENNFVLSLTPRIDRDTTDYAARLLLVDIARREVRLLAARGTLADPRPDFPLFWQSGGVDGGLQILNPQYTGQPTIITPGGPWIRDWALSPGGQRVAWVEAKAPPGDWSRKLPYTCRPCGGKDPEPEVQSIAVWDRATGQIERSPAPDLLWSLGDNTTQQSGSLYWRNDASTLLYATHISDKGGAEGAGQTALRELTSDGRSTLLTEYAWYGNLGILWEAKDRTVYYYISGQSYSGSGSIVRLRPDSKIETLYPQTTHQGWRIDQEGRLAILRQQGITVTDLTNGQAREALFPQAGAGEFDLGWSSIGYLIPLSPDSLWAAFAGSNSDEVIVSPDGKPDRGRVVYIAPVK